MRLHLRILLHVVVLAVLCSAAAPYLGFQAAHAQQGVWLEVKAESLSVRQGPGTGYFPVGALSKGARIDVIAVNPATGWLRIPFAAGPNGEGWVTGDSTYVTVHGDLSTVTHVIEMPPPIMQPPLTGEQIEAGALPLPKLEGKLVFQTYSGGEIYIVNADGSGLRLLTNGLDPALSPDGKMVAFARWEGIPRGLYVINVDGTGERLVYGWDKSGLKSPTWSPDGQRIAFTKQPSDYRFESCLTFKVPVQGKVESITKCFFGPRQPMWTLASIGVNGEDYRDLLCSRFSYSPSWAPNGPQIVYASDLGVALSGDADGLGNTLDDPHNWLLTRYAGDRSPSWDPTGSRIAFQTKSHDHWEIVVMNADGQGRTQITRSWPLADVSTNSVAPAWSPDGQWIVYLTDQQGKWALWVMRPDGTEKAPLLEKVLKDITFEYKSVDERVVSWSR
jgi:uncharacterized protein YraI